MEFIFIRHGHGEHLNDYPHQLNTLHPSLTPYGIHQVNQLKDNINVTPDDLVIVSPTKRTIETASILISHMNFIVSPLVGPRMFPQKLDSPFLACDYILSKDQMLSLYGDVRLIDFDLDIWKKEGINRINQAYFEGYAKQLLDWIGDRFNKIFIISHDGTITNYRILLGEYGLTRKDFLGEGGVYRMTF